MKSVLAGISITKYLSSQAYIAKWLGIIFGSAGGLSIGKEGPNVHMAGIICNQLLKNQNFRIIKEVNFSVEPII